MLTLLWDNDGVLVDTEGLYFQACREMLGSVGVELTLEQFQEISLRKGQSTLELAAGKGLDAEQLDQLRLARDKFYTELLIANSPVIEGVEDVLAELHGRVRMGIVTSARRVHFDAAHASTSIIRYMDFVLSREDYKLSKPHPEPYLTAVQRYGLDPKQCIVIEDSERGLAAAIAAELKCIVVRSHWTRDCEFRGASAIAENIAGVRLEIKKRMPPSAPA